MKLLPHQVKFAKGYKDKDIIAHEGGTGKTVCACVWLHDDRDSDALVICPKRVVDKWKEALKTWQTKATVVSKEQYKKLSPKKWSAIICDEADEFASPLFSKGRSQLSTTLYNQVKAFPDIPILLLTGTPVRSNPWNLHTLLCFKGHYIEWKKWRSEFFTLEYRPFMTRPAYFPRHDLCAEKVFVAILCSHHKRIVVIRNTCGFHNNLTCVIGVQTQRQSDCAFVE